MPSDPTTLGSLSFTTESDVEQKLIITLLTSDEWLGIPLDAIHSKQYLPPTTIDKGAGRRIGYYPDYSIWVDALPLFIIEAKSPQESFEEGFREAQLYAHELNKAYQTGINPVTLVLSTNGRHIRFGNWDSAVATDLAVADLKIGNTAHADIRQRLGISSLRAIATSIRSRLRPTHCFRVVDQMGGEQALNRRLPLNTFAAELARPLRMFFDSDVSDRIDEIIEKAYVSNDEITRYDHIFELFLRDNIAQINDPTGQPLTIRRNTETSLTPELRRYMADFSASGHLQLLIGPVGAGKSLFCRRYYRHLQPEDMASSVQWAFINFNNAPQTTSHLEDWLCRQFINSYAAEHPELDLYSDETLHRIFAPDINRLSKIYHKALELDPIGWEMRLADELKMFSENPTKFAISICRYLIGDTRSAVVVVFDNVDERDRELQLHAFKLAQWFRAETRSFVILPLRDETYEQYKSEPPLDTVINSMHFLISPPRFADVIRKRLELLIQFLASETTDVLSYVLPGGISIVYPKTRLGEYLKSLYLDIFSGGRRISWLLEALSGKNVRESLLMFSRILMSGHLDVRAITTTLLEPTHFHISDTTIIRTLMRTDYVYGADNHGFISNIFYCDQTWKRGSNFLIAETMYLLVRQRKRRSAIGVQGYFQVSEIVDHLTRMGFVTDDIVSGLGYLVRRNLVQADHMAKRAVGPDDYVRAHASGFVHLHLLANRLEYVAASAVDTYLLERNAAVTLARLSQVSPGYSDISYSRKQEVVWTFLQYLKKEYERHCKESPIFQNQAAGSRFLLRAVANSIEGSRSLQKDIENEDDLFGAPPNVGLTYHDDKNERH
jgi:GTPase SAR1 family protein